MQFGENALMLHSCPHAFSGSLHSALVILVVDGGLVALRSR
jgi:hypothetical protein